MSDAHTHTLAVCWRRRRVSCCGSRKRTSQRPRCCLCHALSLARRELELLRQQVRLQTSARFRAAQERLDQMAPTTQGQGVRSLMRDSGRVGVHPMFRNLAAMVSTALGFSARKRRVEWMLRLGPVEGRRSDSKADSCWLRRVAWCVVCRRRARTGRASRATPRRRSRCALPPSRSRRPFLAPRALRCPVPSPSGRLTGLSCVWCGRC